MLGEILKYHVPPRWEESTYSGKRYQLVELAETEQEYKEVTAAFSNLEITRVERLQNPFVYGRYKIRKEYLDLSGSVMESTAYHPVAVADVVKVAEYNCDTRRYTMRNNSQTAGKNPHFFHSPSSAIDLFRNYDNGAVAIIVVKLLNADNAWDSQYWPEYVVYLA